MNSVMSQEIASQAETTANLLSPLRKDVSTLDLTARRVFFGGCGDSYYAAVALAGVFGRLPAPATSSTAQQLAQYTSFTEDDLVILSSISGGTRRTVEAARSARKGGAKTLAVTANRNSPLAETCDNSLVIPYKPISRQTPHTVDYLATLLSLTCAIEQMAGEKFEELDSLALLISQSLVITQEAVHPVAEGVSSQMKYLFLGAGPQRGTAMYAAAKFYEAGGLIALHEEVENFVHGMNFIVHPNDLVCVISTEDQAVFRAKELVRGLVDLGAKVVSVSSADVGAQYPIKLPSSHPIQTPFLEAIGVQVLCLQVANALGLSVESPWAKKPQGNTHLAVQKRWMRETQLI